MDLYNIAKKLSRLVPDRYNNVTQLYIYLHTNKTLQQFTNNFGYETNIRLAFFIDSVKKNIPRQYVEWSINNGLYVFDQICFSKHPGERDCDNCEGDGYIECNNCDQNNEVICDVCNGDGGDEGDCDVCNGDGYVDCDICDSVGRIDCPICDGDGLIIDIDEVPEITVSSYISYDLNTEAELQEYLSMTKEFDIMDFLSRPKLAILERTFNSTNINTSSIPKENWDKCFLNSIKDFDPAYYKPKGSINQMIMAKDYGSYDINDNLTNGS
jgi:hypothetical protein